jgi:methylthioribose-1-phosphate isomerase
VNILLAGIPTRPLLERIRSRCPGEFNLYVAESRPYEGEVARAIAALPAGGIRVSIVTDNMIAALIETVPVREVWSQYLESDGECATAVNGAHMAALLARAHGISCILYPVSDLPPGGSGMFAGEDITVPGAEYIAWEPDIVPLELVSEVVEP